MSERRAKDARTRVRELIESQRPEAMRLSERGSLELLLRGGTVEEYVLNKAERRAVRQFMDAAND
jgi:hypothetical protein